MKNNLIKYTKKELVQKEGKIVTDAVEQSVKTSDVIAEVINTPDGASGYGDLKEQKDRLSILEKCDEIEENKQFLFSDSEISTLKKAFKTFKPFVLSKGLIELQETIEEL